ncbi:MAG: TIGR02099 family protein [Immundisolibacteraceae bacterium]|nr:TIGR02099 family protein [Immundisolibacteraceae bacterium]
MNYRPQIEKALITSLVVVALTLTIVRFALLQIEDQQQLLGQQVSKIVGLPVEFSELSVRLVGISPEITLSNVVIQSEENHRSVLAVDRLKLRISLLASMLSRQPVLELLKVSGVEFSVEVVQERLKLVGFSIEADQSQSDIDLLTDWLFAQQRLQIIDARVHYKDLSRQLDLDVTVSSAQFESVSGGLELAGRLKVDGEIRGNLELAGSIKAINADELQSAPWQLYLDVQELQLANARDRKFQIGGRLALQGWLYGEGFSMAHIDGGLQWSNPSLSNTVALQNGGGELFQSRFDWHRLATGWRGRLHELQFESELANWRGSELLANGGDQVVRIDGGDIDLEVVAGMVSLLFDEGDQKRQVIENLMPVGAINKFEIDLVKTPEKEWMLDGLSLDFDDVGFDSYQNFPAIRGFSGRLTVVKDQGWLAVNSSGLSVAALQVFPETFSFDHLSTQVDWHRIDGGLTVKWANLDLKNSDLLLKSRGTVTVYPGQSPILRAVAEVDQFDLSQVGRYLPTKVIPSGVARWVNGALVSGNLVDMALLWNGRLSEYPYIQNNQIEGLFVMSGEVQGAEVKYVPGSTFPEITRLDADILVEGRRMEIKGHRGYIYDSALSEVTAVIEDLASRDNHVTVMGMVDGGLQDGLRYLTESPLNKTIGRYVSDLSVTGDSHLQLDLDIPFKKGRKARVDGTLELSGNQLDFANTRLSMSDAKGSIEFDSLGLYGTGISVNLFGGPALISIDSISGDSKKSKEIIGGEIDGRKGLVIRGTGLADLESVAEYINWSEFGVTTGTTSWDANLELVAGGVGLKITADIAQAEINLPPPLAKVKNQSGTLELELGCRCSQPAAPIELAVIMDRQWYVDLVLARGGEYPGVSRGVVSGGGRGTLPPDGILLDGDIPKIDFDLWQQWIASLPTGGSGRSVINRIDVNIEQLDIFGQQFPDIQVTGELKADRWSLNVESAEAQGRLDFQPEPELIELDFKKLSLFKPSNKAPFAGQTGFVSFPNLDVNIDNFLFNGTQMGRLGLNVERANTDELIFNRIQLTSVDSQISATGVWKQYTEQGVQRERSYFQGDLETENFGDVLALLGQPQAVSGGDGDAHWALNWTGGPHEFSLANISGDLRLKMKNGSLMGLEPGLGRLFGLFTLDSFQRRISLDFRDLVGTGFAFDKLKTTMTAVNGQLAISTLNLKGPAADIKVRGDIGLEDLSLSLIAETVPKVTESLPLAVTIGSPGLGAAIFIGQRLLGDRIDDVTARTYRITGTADQPVVELVDGNVFKRLLGGRPVAGLDG